jgi:two-component system, sensor histidine kinase
MAGRILIVDDSSDLAELLARLMTHFGHNVRIANCGLQAILTAKEFRPEIVLLDIGLPTLDGFEVAKRIRADSGSNRMRLIALSGYHSQEYQRLGREAGFDAYLSKPVSLKDILGMTQKFLHVGSNRHPSCGAKRAVGRLVELT